MKAFCLFATAALLLSGCSEAVVETVEESHTVETTPVAFNTAGAPTVAFSVPDMMCEFACVEQVKKALSAQPGVEDVKVDFEAKRATVAIDRDVFDREAALATLIDYQFSNSQLIEEEK